MEEEKAAAEATQAPSQQPPEAAPEPSLPSVNKTTVPPEYVAKIQDSKYYKMRSILKDLRPLFLQVLKTPDFRSCKASHEIQEQMKVLMVLYKEITAPTGDNAPKNECTINGAGENKYHKTYMLSDKQRPEDGEGRHIIGGSAFGWNFITYSNSIPVYYGVTKESFRSSRQVKDSV